jgi:hypothetical protein
MTMLGIGMNKLIMAPLCAVFVVSSCASITRGTQENVRIETTPQDAKVVTSFNHTCSTNPCIVSVPRKDSFQVTASKDGYISQTVNVGTKVSGKGAAGVAGNIIAGGVIGVGVDAVTGAARDHTPNPVIINLVPENAFNETKKLRPATGSKNTQPTNVPVS